MMEIVNAVSPYLSFLTIILIPFLNQWVDGKLVVLERKCEERIAAIESEHKTILARVSSVESAHSAITELLRKMQEEVHQAHQESIKAITDLRLDLVRDYTNSTQVQALISDLAADQKTIERRIAELSKDVATQFTSLGNEVANMRGVCSIKGCTA